MSNEIKDRIVTMVEFLIIFGIIFVYVKFFR